MRKFTSKLIKFILDFIFYKAGWYLIEKSDVRLNQFELGQRLKYFAVFPEFGRFISNSTSQYGQDFLVSKLHPIDQSSKFFVEFGALDGITNSNTYYLEKELQWSGIVVEPAKCWHEVISKNRTCKIDYRCVYHSSDQRIMFSELRDWKGGSTISANLKDDGKRRRVQHTYEVKTISLTHLLDEHCAPNYVHFLSIDTEGSEFEILKTLDFKKYQFGTILVEHNHQEEKRSKIYDLLTSNNMIHLDIHQEIIGDDDWYCDQITYKRFKDLMG